MESKLTFVNDPEAQRALLAVAPVAHDEIRGSSKVFPYGSGLLRSLDGLAIDPRHGVAGAKVE
jgi:hypothetical protein